MVRCAVAALAAFLVTSAAANEAIVTTGWDEKSFRAEDTPEARIEIRSGDIDNLGFGWEDGFTPFSGKSTPPHRYPWDADAADPKGTDRIMVGTSFDPGKPPSCETGSDGYTAGTLRGETRPEPITVETGDVGAPTAVLVQMFIDDFQATRWGTKFEVSLNGERLPLFEQALAQIDQTGPIGKLISVKLFPEQFRLLEGGTAVFTIDDTTSGACDGYAVDFIRILVDPKPAAFPVALEGDAVDLETREPIAGALVQAALGSGETVKDGTFRIEDLPAGLVTAQASHPDYEPDMEIADLQVGETGRVQFEMKRRKAETGSLGDTLDANGRVVIPGIYFDTDKATLRPDSLPALEALLGVLEARAELNFVVEGHTDAQGDNAHNQRLSESRAAAVVAWLVERGIDAARLTPAGFGEDRPVADNGTETGRQLNRRVEVAISR